jgi:hypothetical protein
MAYTYTFEEAGVGLRTSNGRLISSTGHDVFGLLYGIYVGMLVLYAYAKLELASIDKRSKLAKRLWLYAICLWLLFHFIALPWRIYSNYFDILFLVALILVSYIAIFIPEAMLLSKIQIYRASNLYAKVLKLKSENEIKAFGMDALLNYIQNLPPNIIPLRENKVHLDI